MTRVLVCGGRDYDNDERVFAVLNSYDADHDFAVVIQGGAKGADMAAKRWAAIGKLTCLTFPANWERHGRAAGPIRNEQMIREGKPDLVIAFPGGKGTRDMVEQARSAGIPVVEVPQ